jgi:antirestriction protein
MGTDFTYTDARLDSRDLLDRLNELEASEADEALDADETAELTMLRDLRDETEGYADDSWRDGVFFVADWAFKDYAIELADEMGAIPKEYSWPASYIDWDAAARDLRMDYTSCEIDGRTYWYR